MLARYRMINPLLGVYYGIFAAAYIGLVVLLLIFEHMGFENRHVIYAMTGAAFALSAVIALAAFTHTNEDFFVSGRRVPAGLNGLIIFVVTVGGAGLSGLLGAVFFLGVDGFGLMFGVLGGMIISGVLLVAFTRKAGSYTVPSFFEIRYRNRMVGFISALMLMVPIFFFALAELSLVKVVGPLVLGVSPHASLLIFMLTALLLTLPGGVRSTNWSQCALAIVVLLGLIIPLVIIALKYTNLPFAQMTYGSLIEDIGKFESLKNEQVASASDVWSGILRGDAQFLHLSFLGGEQGFGVFEKIAFFVVVAGGVAGMPSLLMRSSVVSNVFQARKSFAWGAALIGLVILTLPAYAIFLRYMLFDPQGKLLMASLPGWVGDLQSIGLINPQDINGDGQLGSHEIKLSRDGVFLGLPLVAGLGSTLQSLCFAALMAAALAGFSGRIMTLGQLFARDLSLHKADMEADIVGLKTLMWVRGMILLVTFVLGVVIFQMDLDGFGLFVAGLILCAGSLFPVLLLSIWWRGMTRFGMVAGMLVGFVLAAGALFMTNFGGHAGPFGMSLFEAGLLSMLAAFVFGVVGSLAGAKPSAVDLEVLNEIRTPGGEALYDRILRLAMPRRSIG